MTSSERHTNHILQRNFTARLGDRSLFPDLQARAYLNHAAISPPSRAVIEAVQTVTTDYARRGASAFSSWLDQRTRLREKLARLIGARPEDIALTSNTTRGLIDVALCFPWNATDRIVVFQGEFPANVTPWQRAAALFDLEVVFLPLSDYAEDDTPGLERLERQLRRGVRLVAVSAVQFQTGLRMPLTAISELCHRYGAELCVDGVQACGAVPIDVYATGIDYLACGSHKWLMGLEGAGFLYVSPQRIGALRPSVAGWLSHEDGLGFLFEGPGLLRYDRPIRKRADFVEVGNCNTVGFAALEASLDLILQLGVDAIHAHVTRYLDALEQGLVARGFRSLRAPQPSRRSNILAVLPPEGHSVPALQRALAAQGVSCSTPDGVLRFSPHWPNAMDEVNHVLNAIDTALGK